MQSTEYRQSIWYHVVSESRISEYGDDDGDGDGVWMLTALAAVAATLRQVGSLWGHLNGFLAKTERHYQDPSS